MDLLRFSAFQIILLHCGDVRTISGMEGEEKAQSSVFPHPAQLLLTIFNTLVGRGEGSCMDLV